MQKERPLMQTLSALSPVIMQEVEKGKTYLEIAETLSAAGYTRPGGGKITNWDLSYFLRKNGQRKRKVYKRRRRIAVSLKSVATLTPRPKLNTSFDDVKTLLKSNLAPATKLRIIEALVNTDG